MGPSSVSCHGKCRIRCWIGVRSLSFVAHFRDSAAICHGSKVSFGEAFGLGPVEELAHVDGSWVAGGVCIWLTGDCRVTRTNVSESEVHVQWWSRIVSAKDEEGSTSEQSFHAWLIKADFGASAE